jgi:hypothetical protein
MPRSKAVAVMKAADKARSAERRVAECERALAKAVRARDRADSEYLELVRESLSTREPAPAGEEVAHTA